MPTPATLAFKCHVNSTAPAVITVTVDEVPTEFTVQSTIQWVPSSISEGAQEISLELDPAKLYDETGARIENTFNFTINAQGSDVLICGYTSTVTDSGAVPFDIVSQPVWDAPGWQPYDITGHGPSLDFEGPGSLQILAGQTVEFVGKIKYIDPNPY
jgi:hypothetical protein